MTCRARITIACLILAKYRPFAIVLKIAIGYDGPVSGHYMKKPKEFADRDLHIILLFPKVSWSSMNQFESYDREKWYDQYVLGNRNTNINGAMQIGINVGERLVADPAFLPQVPRPMIYEQQLSAQFGKIELVGHLDGFSPNIPELLEYKTSANPKKWNQKSVDEHGQLDFYALLLWLNYKIDPKKLKIRLVAIPVADTGSFEFEVDGSQSIRIFNTHRSMADIMRFGMRINKVHAEMREFIAKKKLST
jgi:hypothetical protein